MLRRPEEHALSASLARDRGERLRRIDGLDREVREVGNLDRVESGARDQRCAPAPSSRPPRVQGPPAPSGNVSSSRRASAATARDAAASRAGLEVRGARGAHRDDGAADAGSGQPGPRALPPFRRSRTPRRRRRERGTLPPALAPRARSQRGIGRRVGARCPPESPPRRVRRSASRTGGAEGSRARCAVAVAEGAPPSGVTSRPLARVFAPAEVREDLLHRDGLGDGGDDAHPRVAFGASQGIEPERPLQEHRPAATRGGRFRAAGGALGWRRHGEPCPRRCARSRAAPQLRALLSDGRLGGSSPLGTARRRRTRRRASRSRRSRRPLAPVGAACLAAAAEPAPAPPELVGDLLKPEDADALSGINDVYEVVGRFSFQGHDDENLRRVQAIVAGARNEVAGQRARLAELARVPEIARGRARSTSAPPTPRAPTPSSAIATPASSRSPRRAAPAREADGRRHHAGAVP